MRFLRQLLVWVASFSLGSLLTLLVLTSALVISLGDSAHVKRWIEQSTIYDIVVDSVLSETSSDDSQTTALEQAALKPAAQKAFSPAVLQQSAETIIDGTYTWLEGTGTVPEFTVDLSGAKQTFANEVGNYLRNHIAGLPVCAPAEIPAELDIFNLTCRPEGFDFNPEIDQAVQEIATSKDFLDNPVITADTFTTGNEGQKQSVFTQYSAIPDYWQLFKITPYVFGLLVLLAVTIIVFLSVSRRRGLRRVATSLALSGGILVVAAVLAMRSLDNLGEQTNETIQDQALQNSVQAIVKTAGQEIGTVVVWWGAAFVVVAVGLGIGLFATRHRHIASNLPPSEPTPPPAPPSGTIQPTGL